jgi:hypothetical protein
MLGSLLWRGMLAGLCAGILAFGFASVVGEPQVNTSISFEEQHARAAGEPTMPPLVPRDVQSTAGLFTGVALYGIAFGGLFALAFAAAFGRVRRASPARTALWLAAGVFGVVVLVPGLKYPANPPAVGQEATIGRRAAFCFAMVGVSVLAAIATCLAILVAAGVLFPGYDEVPKTFPADTLWNSRVASLGFRLSRGRRSASCSPGSRSGSCGGRDTGAARTERAHAKGSRTSIPSYFLKSRSRLKRVATPCWRMRATR